MKMIFFFLNGDMETNKKVDFRFSNLFLTMLDWAKWQGIWVTLSNVWGVIKTEELFTNGWKIFDSN